MGEAAVTSHAKGTKHQAAVAVREGSSTITSFFSTSTNVVPTSNSTSWSIARPSPRHGIISNVTREESLSAKVLWALKVALFF